MYALLDDVGAYPEFLPWCEAVQIHERTPHSVEASLALRGAGGGSVFLTRHRLEPHERISMELLDGPMRHMRSVWRFEPQEQGTVTSLAVNYEFRNPLIGVVAGPVFRSTLDDLVRYVGARAHALYA